ncbi:hypothetical protein Cgig2_001580 [Carnegiea gigantea]|uniref:MO25-like protein At5g47540 n=1 Tax=Carnegiea gigantea TaxID=171969 RepID=A0A9Q1JVM2_9CARY|nr:hypothetical protein Cgig2_001580 [Carnegiea gigantea]
MKCLFRAKSKIRTPADVVRRTRDLLCFLHDTNNADRGPKWHEKIEELGRLLGELKFILYGSSEVEPVAEACTQVTQEFFQENTLRLLIICLPKLNLEARKDATQVVSNLQRQQVQSRLIACDYLEANIDLMDILVIGYEDHKIALHYGRMLRDCIRHQSIARYVLESHLRKFFDYIELPNFDVSSDVAATFKELLTRHKSTVAEFLSKNYDWLLADILLDRSNLGIVVRYASSKDNLIILMNRLRESSKPIQIEAFHIFKLFAANTNKPPEVVHILALNRSKLLRFLDTFKLDKEDEQFEADKAQVIQELIHLTKEI